MLHGRARYGRQLSGEIQGTYMILHFVCDLLPRPQGFVFLVTRLIPRNMQPSRFTLGDHASQEEKEEMKEKR